MTPRAVAVRAAPLPFLMLATALVPQHGPAVILLAAPGAGLTLAAPAAVGALPALGTELLLWLAAYGTHDIPSPGRTAAFAAALYLAHAATALAASVPTGAVVHRDVLVAWARRCLPGLALAGGAAGITATLGDPAGSPALDLAGLAAALLCAAITVRMCRARADGNRLTSGAVRGSRSRPRTEDGARTGAVIT